MTLRACLLRTLAAFLLGMGLVAPAWAQEVGIMQSSLCSAKNGEKSGLYLSATVEFDLPRSVEDALLRGIALYFVTDFTLERHRWYWLDKTQSETSLISRLSYSPLTRQYRVSRGGLSQSFDSLRDALDVIKVITDWRVSDKASLSEPENYQAEVRFRLDTQQLPLPMQVSIGNNDWNLSSDWQTIVLDQCVITPKE